MTIAKPPFWASVQKHLDTRWYMPLISLLAGLDLFLMVIPTDGLLISAVLVKPQHWFRRAVWVSTGSALGALVLSLLLIENATVVREVLSFAVTDSAWNEAERFLLQWGRFALAFLAMSIFPTAPGVMVAAVSEMNPIEIAFGVWIGRLVKYIAFSFVAAKAPQVLGKLWIVRSEIETVRQAGIKSGETLESADKKIEL